MATIKKSMGSKDVEYLKLLHIADGNWRWYNHFGK